MQPVRKLFILLFALAFVAGACGGNTVSGGNAPATEPASPVETEASSSTGETEAVEVSGDLVIYSGRSEPLLQPVIDAFRAQYPNVNVLLKAGSNSELANALIEEKGNPQADVFITTELFTVQSLAPEGVFQAYAPAGVENIPAGFIGEGNLWTGLTRRARVIMYNQDLVSEEEAPASIFDLVDPKWKGQIAAAGSTNGGMQAQIAAMQQLLGDEATEQWLNGLIANEVTFFGGHTDVRKAVGAGEFKIGLVNHYYYHLQLAETGNVGVVYPDQGEGEIGLITNATAAAVVNGAPHPEAAQAFLDFLVSAEGQKLFAEQNYEYPLLAGVALKEGVQPLENFRLADVDVVKAAANFEAAFDLIERVGLP
ncbi:MAG: ABC transporter substrate-binding protein [Chloroflexi bacterium]|nr:ABC transporter substrate-binding protein [Chloroflexota bacterium]MDL1944092.1 extracellular solute-binding protein [Chloroflexi bacterium CFX2]